MSNWFGLTVAASFLSPNFRRRGLGHSSGSVQTIKTVLVLTAPIDRALIFLLFLLTERVSLRAVNVVHCLCHRQTPMGNVQFKLPQTNLSLLFTRLLCYKHIISWKVLEVRLCKYINIRPSNQSGYLNQSYECEPCLILSFKTAFQEQTEFGLYRNHFGTIGFFFRD